jgi:hypothetical protein
MPVTGVSVGPGLKLFMRIRRSFRSLVQLRERVAAARKEPMRVSRLPRAGARFGRVEQSVAVEHDDLFEMGRNGFRRREASHPGANNDRLLQNRI